MTIPEETTKPATSAPGYRYITVLPEVLRLKADDLTAFLPDGAWIGSPADKQREIAVPTAGILQTNYPRIHFSRLCDLLPGCIQPIEDAPEWVALPTDRVALAYRPETRRESIPGGSPEIPAPTTPPVIAAPEPRPVEPRAEAPIPAWKRLPKPVLAPAPESQPIPVSKVNLPEPPTSLPLLQVTATADPLLKDLFGAATTLSVQQLVEACRALPGVKACKLNRDGECVKAGDLIPELDASGLKSEVFAAVRKISAASRLKIKKALTFYTDAGPVSFLRHRELILTVLHDATGPVPDTLAKLKAALQAIDAAGKTV